MSQVVEVPSFSINEGETQNSFAIRKFFYDNILKIPSELMAGITSDNAILFSNLITKKILFNVTYDTNTESYIKSILTVHNTTL